MAALVGLTGAPQPARLEMALTGLSIPALHFHVVMRALRDEDAAATVVDIAAGRSARCLLSWVSLMRGGGDRGIIELWTQVADDEPDSRNKATYGALALTFAELAGCEPQWRQGLEGWNMRESTVVNEWKAEAKAEGRLEGKLEGERDALLRILMLKFQSPVALDLAATVERETDPRVLARWLENAVRSETLEAFRAAMRPS